MAFRTVAEAAKVKEISEEELQQLKHTKEDICCYGEGRVRRVRWHDDPRTRIGGTGLMGHCHVLHAHGEALPEGPVRIHFCKTIPCTGVFDGMTTLVPHCHVVALRTMARDTPSSALPSVEEPPCSSCQPALAAPCATDKADEGIPAPSNIKLLADQWTPAFKYMGLFAFLVWGAKEQKEVRVWLFKNQYVDLVATWAPWLLNSADGSMVALPVVELVACRVQRVDDSCVSAQMCQVASELSSINHFIPLVNAPWGRRNLVPTHHPCNGALCGQIGGHCMAALQAETQAFGKLPYRSVADGNCAPDTMLFLSGRVRTELTRKIQRVEITKAMREFSGDCRWEEASVNIEGVGVPAHPPLVEPIIIDDEPGPAPCDSDDESIPTQYDSDSDAEDCVIGSSPPHFAVPLPPTPSSGHLAAKADAFLSSSLPSPAPISDQPVVALPSSLPVAKPALAIIGALVAKLPSQPEQALSTEQPMVEFAAPPLPAQHAGVAGPAFAALSSSSSASSEQYAVEEALPLPALLAPRGLKRSRPGDCRTTGSEQLDIEAAILKQLGLKRLSPVEMKRLLENLSPETRQGLLHQESGGNTSIQEHAGSSPAPSPMKRKDENLMMKRKHSQTIAKYAARVGVDAKQRVPKRFWEGFFRDYYCGKVPTGGFTSKEKMYFKRRLRESPHLRTVTQNAHRHRVSGTQGKPVKAIIIEEELIRWFAGVRRLGARVSPPDSRFILKGSLLHFRSTPKCVRPNIITSK